MSSSPGDITEGDDDINLDQLIESCANAVNQEKLKMNEVRFVLKSHFFMCID